MHHPKAALHPPLPPQNNEHALHDLQVRSIHKALDLATCAEEQGEFLDLMSSGDADKMLAATRQPDLSADLQGVEAARVSETLSQVLPPYVICHKYN